MAQVDSGTLVSEPAASIDARLLGTAFRHVHFAPGEVLRRKGQHYRDMYWLTEGAVDVDIDGTAAPLARGAGLPVGEIAFLRGCPATATVTAKTIARALLIDDPALARLEHEQPAAAAQLLRHLAEVAEERTSSNVTFVASPFGHKGTAIEIHLCRNAAMLESAQRLRYEVYCQELGRSSPYADHERKTIADDLDKTGHVFIAVEAGETIGTLRGNVPSEGSLGVLEELYGMRTSPHYPRSTAVCTKLIVKRSQRGGPAAMKLIAAMVRYGTRSWDAKECYIDCIPALLPYYKALGFKPAGPKFFHRENGPSWPMMIDLVKHARLGRDWAAHEYLALYVKAKVIKWFDGAWRSSIDSAAP